MKRVSGIIIAANIMDNVAHLLTSSLNIRAKYAKSFTLYMYIIWNIPLIKERF